MVIARYNLEDYANLETVEVLSQDSVILIEELSILFANVKPLENKKKRSGRRRDDNYVPDPNFKATTFPKFEGHDLLCQQVNVSINKLTKVNYMTMRNNIFEKIEEIIEKSNKEQKNSFVTNLMILMSKDKFNSEINVSLYSEILNKYELFKNSKKIILNEYKVITETIKVVNIEDYDEHCENNLLNDRRKAMGMFVANMIKKRILNKEVILEKLVEYQQKLKEYIEIENMKEIVEQIAENIYILIENIRSELYNDEEFKKIIEEVKNVTKLVVKEKKSLTSRAKFKHMDIISDYEKFVKTLDG